MKLILAILISFCFYSCSIFSQHVVKSSELSVLSSVDTNLNTILDSVLIFEKNCDYYSDSLFFTIDIRMVKESYELQISSSNNINEALDYFEPIYGCLYYKNHLFIIYNPISERFFKRTEKKCKFNYTKFDKSYQKEDTLILHHIIDDSYTYWTYWYENGVFIFKDRSSSCS